MRVAVVPVPEVRVPLLLLLPLDEPDDTDEPSGRDIVVSDSSSLLSPVFCGGEGASDAEYSSSTDEAADAAKIRLLLEVFPVFRKILPVFVENLGVVLLVD